MAGEWREMCWGDLATLEYGKGLRGYESGSGPFRVFGTNGPIGWHTEPLSRHPTVVVGRKGAYRGVHYSPEPCFVIDTAFYLDPRTEFDMRWAYYELLTHDINSMDSGSAIPSTSRESFYRLSVRVPPLREQRAIAYILGTLDDKIELNRRMSETLQAMPRAIFKSWFVDFDPVPAKAEGRDPGLPKPIADLFPARFGDSELGEIPAGWEVVSIGDLANVVGGSTPSTKEPAYWDDGIHHWATPRDLSRLSVPVLLETERKITDAGLAQISSGLLPAGTVLLSSRAPIGYLAIAEVPVGINQGFIAMKPQKGTSNLFLLLWAVFAHDDILSRANGSTFQEISKANFRPIPLAAPPAGVMQAFDEGVRPFYGRIVMAIMEAWHEHRG
ncbi:MAG: restriction endonuclease subunit S [Deltaproteobacteria bacterium]|nr:restriction endonuclease subunit S [Deltaproteobacteria bacterium]